jgi:multiple sugar transport system ATP-binding protein
MADHVVVMKDGVIEQQGAPLELYDRPANRFVAGFIGSPAMNFVPAVVGEDGRSLAVDVGEKQTIVLDRQLQPGRKVTAGLRPEHLHFVEPGQGVFRLPVGIVESTGSATYITTSTAAEVTIVETSRRQVKTGDVIDVSIRPADVHVFDGETGLRV